VSHPTIIVVGPWEWGQYNNIIISVHSIGTLYPLPRMMGELHRYLSMFEQKTNAFDAWACRYEGDFALEFELEDGANRSTQGASGQGASMAALALDEKRGLRSVDRSPYIFKP
jgi:hypothetical protein